jgi:hypothetical protein
MFELSKVEAHHCTNLDGMNRFGLVALHPRKPKKLSQSFASIGSPGLVVRNMPRSSMTAGTGAESV